jgi:hypothetical protein
MSRPNFCICSQGDALRKNFAKHAVGHNVEIGMALSVPANLESGATKRQSKNKK